MSFRQVRPSKFRNVFGTAWKREQCYDNIRVSKYSWDSTFCSVNPKFIAVITESAGGGAFIVLPLIKHKVGRVSADHPLVAGHRGPVLDIAWSPHNDNLIASGSEDCVVKIWDIPDEGLTKTLTESSVDLIYHQRRVGLVLWHPSAQDVLLTAGSDNLVVIWNVGTGEPTVVIDAHPDLVYSACWNWDGSHFLTTCRDKRIRILNPRTGHVVEEAICHESSKTTRAIYLRNGLIFTTGFSKMNERQYSLRAPQHLNDPIVMVELDTSNGVMFPFYDADTNMVYLCGKGDSVIRYFEVTPDPPFVHYINKFQSPDAQRGIGMMPKRGCDVTSCEITRFFRLNNSGLCQIVSMTVPRKMDEFQEAEIVKPETFLLRRQQQQPQQTRRKSFHDLRADNTPSSASDKRPAGRRLSLLPADTAPLTTLQVASSTPHRSGSFNGLNKADRCPTNAITPSPECYLHRKASLPPLPMEPNPELRAQHLKARRSLTADFTVSAVLQETTSAVFTPARSRQQKQVPAKMLPVFRTPNQPKNRQPLNSLTSMKPRTEFIQQKSTPSALQSSLDSIPLSSPEDSSDSDQTPNLELENWPALETSYAQLMDCDLIECCLSVHEDLSCDTSDIQEQMSSILNFSRSTANGSLCFSTSKKPAMTISPIESPSDASHHSTSPELPRPLRILRHWMKVMEERLPEVVGQSPDQGESVQRHRKAELEALRKEIEGRSSYFLNIERRCTSDLQHVGRELESRYHRLLLRIMEWSFHLKNPPAETKRSRSLSRSNDSQLSVILPPDESPPADELPDELNALQVWLRLMEQRVPELKLKAKWSRRTLQVRMIEFQALQQEIEQRAAQFAELVQQCPPRQRQKARDLEGRYHQLLLRIFEWNFHMESISVNSDDPAIDDPVEDVHDDFQLVMEESYPEAEPEWDSCGSNDILPSPGPSSPADGHVPLSMELESCGWGNPEAETELNSAGISDEMYMDYVSNRRQHFSDEDDATSCKSCCTSPEDPEQFETIDLTTDDAVANANPAAQPCQDSTLPVNVSHANDKAPDSELPADPDPSATQSQRKNSTSSVAVPVASDISTPTVSELFQEDLYPDTPCDVAALTADEWFAGRDEIPVLMSMKSVGHQPLSRSDVRTAVPVKNRYSRVPPARPAKPDPSHLQAVLEQYDNERCRQPSGESIKSQASSTNKSPTGSDSSRPESLDRYSHTLSHPSPPHSINSSTAPHRVEELMDEIHRLHLLIYQHEERFRSMEARMAENDVKRAANVVERPVEVKAAQINDHKSGISSKVMTLVFSPLTVFSVMRQEMPSPFAFVSTNRLMSLKPFQAISTTRRLLLSPVSSISAISSSLISALSNPPK